MMIRKHKLFYLIILITMTGGNRMLTESEFGNEDYALKAKFINRFADYVYWKNFSKEQTLQIAILEDCPITALLQNTTKKKIAIKEYKNLKDIYSCHILFVPYNCTIPIETILSNFSGKQVLIVTERNNYGKKGAHMNFVSIENKLKFEINLKAINKTGIGISSLLLQHAIIVE